ncbi:MAG: 3'-5' exonuclease [Geminicoccaceae bacterium]
MYLFFDTETTGMYNFKSTHDDPAQPHIVQLAACLVDKIGNVRGSMNMIVKPPIPIPEGASAVHGITDEIAEHYGFELDEALDVFWKLEARAETLVAHNVNFDRKMLRSAFHRADMHNSFDAFSRAKTFCTMQATTPILKLPGHRGYKWPRLEEAYSHFFDEPLEGAHDAMIDVMACKDVFFALKATETTERVLQSAALRSVREQEGDD